MSINTEKTPVWTRGNRLVGYDPELRRLWVGGQRLHHGATGAALVGLAMASLVGKRNPRGLAFLLAGTAMCADDWHDRSVWFKLGDQR